MTIRLPRDFLFPLAMVAFIALTVRYLGFVFTTSTRWIFLFLLAAYLVSRGRVMTGLQSVFGVTVLLYCCWCVLTAIWSEVPVLSLEKVVALVLLAPAFLSGGLCWARDRDGPNAINFLVPVTAVALFAGIGGYNESMSTGGTESVQLHGGLTHPNMMGALIVMSLPLLLWTAYKYRSAPQARWLWMGLVAVAVVLLLRSISRSSMLGGGAIVGLFLFSLKLSPKVFYMLIIATVLAFAGVVGTTVVQMINKDYLYKGGGQEEGILYSRRTPWEESYQGAVEGGWFGVGYGVSVGDTSFTFDLTAEKYGREKGNSQLAIVEETGVVGLALYSALLLTLFGRLFWVWRQEKPGDMKVVLGLVTGSLCAITITSLFEAWWVAPGSPESAFFWSLAGVALGLAEKSRQGAQLTNRTPSVPSLAFNPAFRRQTGPMVD